MRMNDASRSRYSSERLPNGRWAPRVPAHNLNLAACDMARDCFAGSLPKPATSNLKSVRFRLTSTADGDSTNFCSNPELALAIRDSNDDSRGKTLKETKLQRVGDFLATGRPAPHMQHSHWAARERGSCQDSEPLHHLTISSLRSCQIHSRQYVGV